MKICIMKDLRVAAFKCKFSVYVTRETVLNRFFLREMQNSHISNQYIGPTVDVIIRKMSFESDVLFEVKSTTQSQILASNTYTQGLRISEKVQIMKLIWRASSSFIIILNYYHSSPFSRFFSSFQILLLTYNRDYEKGRQLC